MSHGSFRVRVSKNVGKLSGKQEVKDVEADLKCPMDWNAWGGKYRIQFVLDMFKEELYWSIGVEQVEAGRRQPAGQDEGEGGGEEWPSDQDNQGQVGAQIRIGLVGRFFLAGK